MSTMTENLPFSLSDDEADFEFEDHRKEQLDLLDFKMVTFTLGGKDYGIDIIKIKEISKANRFTYVPNAAPYVRGVYNLRGDIISIIDLRTMFNIPVVKKSQAAVSSLSIAGEEGGANEEMLILRLEHNTLGVIVDSIDKVVGASSKNIQPPHPIFGDINIQFIHGIVESDKRLYIILDVEKIFSQNVPEQESRPRPAVPAPGEAALSENSLEFTFTVDALAALGQFYVSALNQDWVKIRLTEWMKRRKLQGEDFQFKNSAEAEEFLRGFYSPGTGAFWNDDLINSLKALLPGTSAPGVNVWNIGCGAGFETYSLACALKEKYPGKRVRIWANDNNLINISGAPTLAASGDMPDYYTPFLSPAGSVQQFNTEIKEMTLFEYHDILHSNHVPAMDMIVARDVLSFLKPEDQSRLLAEFGSVLRPKGILILGKNEQLQAAGWSAVQQGIITAHLKE